MVAAEENLDDPDAPQSGEDDLGLDAPQVDEDDLGFNRSSAVTTPAIQVSDGGGLKLLCMLACQSVSHSVGIFFRVTQQDKNYYFHLLLVQALS